MQTRRRRHAGMTMLEIMIVLAIIALVMGLVVGPKIMAHYRSSERNVARMTVHRYAEQDYPTWLVEHPSERCPDSLAQISLSSAPPADPWGTDYKMYCGTDAPRDDINFGAASFGEDHREATRDDIRSWD
ncbi:MAG TPA: type II secretion system protein [Kofleriaceae bacterium]